MNTKTILILVILIVAAIIGAAFLFPRETGERETSESGVTGESAGLIVKENAIYVAEQAPSNIVSVAVVRLEKPGFVVIHEDANSAPGKILGASGLLMAGETKDSLQIVLSRPTVDEETVYAMLHFDDGDRTFDATQDRSVFDSMTGEPVMMVVVISKGATEPGAVNP